PARGAPPAPPLLPERFGDRLADLRAHSTQNGLTSSFPNLATGCLDATSMASSRSAQSMMSYPAICSLVSANGPSAISTSPPRTDTVVASLTGRSWLPSSRIPRRSISSTQASVSGPTRALSSGLSSVPSATQTSIMYLTVSSAALIMIPRAVPGVLAARASRGDRQPPTGAAGLPGPVRCAPDPGRVPGTRRRGRLVPQGLHPLGNDRPVEVRVHGVLLDRGPGRPGIVVTPTTKPGGRDGHLGQKFPWPARRRSGHCQRAGQGALGGGAQDGRRFSRNAAIPSAASAEANSAWETSVARVNAASRFIPGIV